MLESTLEILQQFYIQMEIEPDDFHLFSWGFFLIHLKVYEMLQACYCYLFNWKNLITCTHCNCISLEHDSIPRQAKSQRINVNATLLFTSYDNYLRSSKSFQVHLNWIEKIGCRNQSNMDTLCFMRLLTA